MPKNPQVNVKPFFKILSLYLSPNRLKYIQAWFQKEYSLKPNFFLLWSMFHKLRSLLIFSLISSFGDLFLFVQSLNSTICTKMQIKFVKLLSKGPIINQIFDGNFWFVCWWPLWVMTSGNQSLHWLINHATFFNSERWTIPISREKLIMISFFKLI